MSLAIVENLKFHNIAKYQSGIYYIKNTKTSKMYVGSSNDIKRRLSEHSYDLCHNRHCNPYLQSSFNKHKVEVFEVGVLEFCDEQLLEQQEKFWIDYYNSYIDKKGYNVVEPYHGIVLQETKDKIGRANKGKVRSEELKKRISATKKGTIPWNKGLTREDPRVAKHCHVKGQFKQKPETILKIQESKRKKKEEETL